MTEAKINENYMYTDLTLLMQVHLQEKVKLIHKIIKKACLLIHIQCI